VLAPGIVGWFANPYNRELLDKLRAAGVNPRAEARPRASALLDGQTFVLTGTLSGLSRDEATALIEAHGGRVVGTVSKKTSYLLIGDAPGSKAEKAARLGVPFLTEAELRALVGA
jgi:DNA ligase (NAD+)